MAKTICGLNNCQRSFDTIAGLEAHRKNFHHPCDRCSRVLGSAEALDQHRNSHFSGDSQPSSPPTLTSQQVQDYRCAAQNCNQGGFSSEKAVAKHRVSAHNGCFNCNRSFPTAAGGAEHRSVCAGPGSRSNSNRSRNASSLATPPPSPQSTFATSSSTAYRCAVCNNTTFKSEHDVAFHRVKDHFGCRLCNRSFQSESAGAAHRAVCGTSRDATPPVQAPTLFASLVTSIRNNLQPASQQNAVPMSPLDLSDMTLQRHYPNLSTASPTSMMASPSTQNAFSTSPLTPYPHYSVPQAPITRDSMVYRSLRLLVSANIQPNQRGTLEFFDKRFEDCDLVRRLAQSHQYKLDLLGAFTFREDDPRVQTAVHADGKVLCGLLKLLLESQDLYQRAVRLRGDLAKGLVNLLFEIWNLNIPSDNSLIGLSRRLYCKMAVFAAELPSGLFIRRGAITDVSVWPKAAGGFGHVHTGKFNEQLVALKRPQVFEDASHDLKPYAFKEAALWHSLKHEHILPLLGVDAVSFEDAGVFALVSPWMRNGTLLDFLKEKPRSTGLRMKLLHQVAQGLAYLHQSGVVHGDLRGANILIDQDESVRLSDFGLSAFWDATMRTKTSNRDGCREWMAPELHQFEDDSRFKRTLESDVWAYGCVCIEVFTLEPPFARRGHPALLLLQKERPSQPANMSDKFYAILKRCWEELPKDRPTMAQVTMDVRACL